MSSVPVPEEPANESETGMPSTTVLTSVARPPRTKSWSPSCATPACVAIASAVVLIARIFDVSPESISLYEALPSRPIFLPRAGHLTFFSSSALAFNVIAPSLVSSPPLMTTSGIVFVSAEICSIVTA